MYIREKGNQYGNKQDDKRCQCRRVCVILPDTQVHRMLTHLAEFQKQVPVLENGCTAGAASMLH
ncbi:MAG TPA: hypothetical protein VNW52_04505 [Burkholderiaceae bacterium]|nr:hypothetical protein [Burkholderiaceae bacterium]